MLARIRKAAEKKDSGFTLIELLVVMIIIGILAAIAIPAFLSQRAKARDSSTKADVSTIGKEISSYYVDGAAGAVTLAISGNVATTTVGTVPITTRVSTGTVAATANATFGTTSTTWCVALTNAGGSSTPTWRYSAARGLEAGDCTTAALT